MGPGEKSEDPTTLPRLPPGISVRLRLRRVPGVSSPSPRNPPSSRCTYLVDRRELEANLAAFRRGELRHRPRDVEYSGHNNPGSARSPHEETCHRPQSTASGWPWRAGCELHILRYGLRTWCREIDTRRSESSTENRVELHRHHGDECTRNWIRVVLPTLGRVEHFMEQRKTPRLVRFHAGLSGASIARPGNTNAPPCARRAIFLAEQHFVAWSQILPTGCRIPYTEAVDTSHELGEFPRRCRRDRQVVGAPVLATGNSRSLWGLRTTCFATTRACWACAGCSFRSRCA